MCHLIELQRPTIITLPDDIFHHIFEHLITKDLLSICLTNNHLRAMAEPYLYRQIDMEWTFTNPPRIVDLLRTLLRRPTLAEHIRSLHLTARVTDWSVEDDGLPSIDTNGLEYDVVEQAIMNTRLPFADQWKAEVIDGSMDALIALLLAHTPKLTSILMERHWSRQPRLMCMVIAGGLTKSFELPSYTMLTEVRLGWLVESECTQGKYTMNLLTLFYLTSIQHLTLSLDNPALLHWPTQMPLCASLVSLHIKDIDEVLLYTVLKATPSIKQLRWQVYRSGFIPWSSHKRVLNIDDLMRALDLISNSLEVLDIILLGSFEDSDYVEDAQGELQVTGSVKALKQFGSLKMLRVPLLWLDDFLQDEEANFEDTLPRTLQKLILVDDLADLSSWEQDDRKIVRALEVMLQHRSTYFPYLTSILIAVDQEAELRQGNWQDTVREHVCELGRIHDFQLSIEEHTWLELQAVGFG